MSRIYKTETVTREIETLDEIRCDLCGAVGKDGTWERGVWEVNNTTVEVAIGTGDL